MHRNLTIVLFFIFPISQLCAQQSYSPFLEELQTADWLIQPVNQKAGVYYTADKKGIILYNGLTKRTFTLAPGFACIDYKNMSNGQQLLRSVQPEAKLTIDDSAYNVGGLYGQTENAYLLPSWINSFTTNNAGFVYKNFSVSDMQPFLNWKCTTWAFNKKQATGKMLTIYFEGNREAVKNITVEIKYEIYDGLPLITKSLVIKNNSNKAVKLNRVINEVLGVVEEGSAVVGSEEKMAKQHGIYIESNYAFNNSMNYNESDQTTHWQKDTTYTSQVNYNLTTPCLLQVYAENAPGIALQPGETFHSIRTNELLLDSYDRERRGLMVQQMYRTVAPWTTQNPIFMHLVSKNDEEVYNAIDQCAATGYEALILSFGSHCKMEDTSAANIQHWKKIAGYAHSKNILIGCYSLFSSRHISDSDDVINPATGKPGGAFFGNAPCYGSKWGLTYRDKIKYFFAQTDFNIWENDGPYPGDICASTTHPGHKDKDDSQWRQMEIQKELYHWLNERGVYINAPDWYILDGTNKLPLGYREANFSLPRDQQKILNRQNIFDGTWEKTPSMGWGFVPLTVYQGGGAEAVLEPLSAHLKDYEQLMMQYYGAGIQACYRGPRLYDNDTTKATVIKVINWYKQHRGILNSSVIHLRRADGRDWDGWMHINPSLKEKALVMLFNPTKEKITRNIKLPLYYAGLNNKASISIMGAPAVTMQLDRSYNISLPVTLNAGEYKWIVIEQNGFNEAHTNQLQHAAGH
ncbi:hypothetical protein SAMN05444277_103151 [Parafilimonas terrae]|uniref:Alpha-galactosidase n=2 Tax=Parafilimonas terrae TaxID=1465490 RepID=A0A1I5U9H3_9BACT|nr:hypothetical protein SAMN05444277_103151 [Parafilimonas terrae]